MRGLPSPGGRALGTGPHGHRRGMMLRDGIRVGFNICLLGTTPDRHCPDEPDPMVRWAERVMGPRPEPEPDLCPRGLHRSPVDAEGRCVECRREVNRRSGRRYRDRHRAA